MMKELASRGAAAALCAACDAATLRPGDAIAGFKVISVETLPDIEASAVRMEYSANGAELLWLDRADDNKTFAIAFRTMPEDDTGVPHIIEHSVLCGSEKYPVKEPFVELLKSSFATFINAWTAPDHTAYPVCSRDPKDFLNLVDVYLDAVFRPLSVRSPEAFMQEGWHWECGADGVPKGVNGVVYSEMKGALADPRSLAAVELERLAFAGNAYRFVAGGDPESIPDLTFAQYKAFHEKNYHPSNAKVFLDGRVDLRAVLERLDAYFRGYARRPPQALEPDIAPTVVSRTVAYAPAEGESVRDKTILADGWPVCGFGDTRRRIALGVLAQYLAGSNEDPVPRALLDAGLCDDASIETLGCAQVFAALFVENVRDGKAAETRAAVRRAISDAIEAGFDVRRLEALLSREEFEYRERDYGSHPRGLAFFISATDRWMYGGDPLAGFKAGGIYAELRAAAREGFFERLAREIFLDNPGHVMLDLVPDPTLAAKREAALASRIATAAASMTDADRRENAAAAARLAAFQTKKDSPEELATLPVLRVSDISPDAPVPEHSFAAGPDGAKICSVRTGAKGVVYATLAFPMDGLSPEEAADAAFAADLLGELPTARRTALELKSEIDANLGRFSANAAPYSVPASAAGGDPSLGRAFLEVRAAALDAKAGEILRLLPEILSETSFADAKRVGDAQRQRRRDLELSACGISARKLAKVRAAAGVSGAAALEDRFSGIFALRRLQAADDTFAEESAGRCAALAAALAKCVGRGAAWIFVSANAPQGFAESLAAAFPRKEDGTADAADAFARPLPAKDEGFTSAGGVASAARAFRLKDGAHGASFVAARMLSLGHLWNEIRVLGGAYGGSLSLVQDGLSCYLSWNDPSPARSLGVYAASGAALRKEAEGGIDRYIPGAVAATEPYLSPSAEMNAVSSLALAGRTREDLSRIRREMLAATPQDVARFADALDAAAASGPAPACIVGGAAQVESCGASLSSITPVAPQAADLVE